MLASRSFVVTTISYGARPDAGCPRTPGLRRCRRVCYRLKTEGALLRPQLARCDASIPAADPVGGQAAVFLGRHFPREVTGVERMDLTVGEELLEVLVV
jgi:hypothetical protein